jgi:hypothetical protein
MNYCALLGVVNYCHPTEGQLTGSIPASLGNLVNLKSLTLNQNKLEGDIPVELGKLVNLEQLLLRTVLSITLVAGALLPSPPSNQHRWKKPLLGMVFGCLSTQHVLSWIVPSVFLFSRC